MPLRLKHFYVGVLSMLCLFICIVTGAQLANAMTASAPSGTSATIDWGGTGSSPYTLKRNGNTLYSGSSTSFVEYNLQYNTSYTYNLDYQNYEQTGGGYYVNDQYWGVTTAGHYRSTYKDIPWCSGSDSYGNYYSHSPPCDVNTNETTISVPDEEWVPDQYGWISYQRWVDYQYSYVTSSTTITITPPKISLNANTVSIINGSTGGTVNRTEYYLSGATSTGWTTYSGPFNLSNASQTTIYARTIDSAERSSSWGTFSPPSVTNMTISSSGFNYNLTFGQAGTVLVPQISVSDLEGDTLVSSYYVDAETTPRDSKTISNTMTAQVVAFNGLPVDGLSEGKHTLKFQVSDNKTAAVINTIDFNIDKSPPVIGTISTTSTDTSITTAGTAADSGVGLATAPYRYTIGSSLSAWMSNSYTATNLTPNTSYNVRVEARDHIENISTRNLTMYTKAQTPAVTVTQATESALGIQLTDSNPSGTAYQIKLGGQYVSASGVLTMTPTSIIPTNKQILVQGLTANQTYAIQALALNQEGIATSWSQVINGTTLAQPPTNLSSSRTQTSIKVNWPASSGAIRYDIEVDGVVISAGTAIEYTQLNIAPESRHTYRVRIANAGGLSSWSEPFIVFSLPYPPVTPGNITLSSVQTEIQLTWDSVAKADSYVIEADGSELGISTQPAYTHTGLEPETEHVYRVKARNSGGASPWSQPLTKKTLPYPPETPTNFEAELSIHSVALSWTKPDRATAYEIEVDGLIIDNGNQTTYLHEGLDALSGHTYRIRAKNIGGKSAWSDPLDVTTHPEIPDIPTNIMTTAEENAITVTWYKVLHAASYEVEIDGTSIVNLTNNQLNHSDLTPNSSHTYRVRARNISGSSEWSSPITLSTFPSGSDSNLSLTNVAAIVTNRFITLSWDTVAPQARYDIEVDGVLVNNGDNTIYHHTGLKSNEFHTYKIRLKNEDQPGEWVAILSLSTLPDPPDAPTEIQAFANNTSIEIRWHKMTGATEYDIEIDGKTIDAVTDSDYLHDELSSGTSHTYRVRAKNVTGVTAWSAAIVKSTTNPTYTVNGVKDKNFDLSLLASNVQDFSELTYVVTYDPNQLEAVDLFGFTPQLDLPTSGRIPGSNLEVTYSAGRITFKINQNVVPGTSWSGEIATIVFKSKIDGQSEINVVVEKEE